jgi:hypothetical protein
MRRSINITLEPNVYHDTKKVAPKGEISPFINKVLKEHLKIYKQQELKESYKRTAKSKAMKEENKV